MLFIDIAIEVGCQLGKQLRRERQQLEQDKYSRRRHNEDWNLGKNPEISSSDCRFCMDVHDGGPAAAAVAVRLFRAALYLHDGVLSFAHSEVRRTLQLLQPKFRAGPEYRHELPLPS